MKHFEITFIIKPDLNNNLLDSKIEKISKTLTDNEAKIIGTEKWGLRDLAYSINGLKKGFFIYIQIDIKNDKFKEIKNIFNLDEEIVRYLIIKVNNNETLPSIIMSSQKNDS